MGNPARAGRKGSAGCRIAEGLLRPRRHAAASLFDWGILANVMHGSLMVYQAFAYPNEHAHMWGDIPLLFAVSGVMWYWHPNRIGRHRSPDA